MNRTSMAALAICLAAGMAGMAQAQTSPSTTPSPGMGGTAPSLGAQSQTPPSTATSPSYSTSQSSMPHGSMPQNSMQGAAAEPTQADIQQAQQQLKAQGLYHGAIDGEIGPKTKMAISRFQRRNGLPATAMLDQQTLQRLEGSATSGAGSTMAPTSPQAPNASAGSNMNSTAPRAPTKHY